MLRVAALRPAPTRRPAPQERAAQREAEAEHARAERNEARAERDEARAAAVRERRDEAARGREADAALARAKAGRRDEAKRVAKERAAADARVKARPAVLSRARSANLGAWATTLPVWSMLRQRQGAGAAAWGIVRQGRLAHLRLLGRAGTWLPSSVCCAPALYPQPLACRAHGAYPILAQEALAAQARAEEEARRLKAAAAAAAERGDAAARARAAAAEAHAADAEARAAAAAAAAEDARRQRAEEVGPASVSRVCRRDALQGACLLEDCPMWPSLFAVCTSLRGGAALLGMHGSTKLFSKTCDAARAAEYACCRAL